jgi:hypothetical protein
VLRAFGHYFDVVRDEGAQQPRLRITLDAYLDALLTPHSWQPLGSSREAVADDLLRDVYATIRSHAIRQTAKPLFIDKVTPYHGTSDLVVRTIGRLFPRARIIHLVRDGRDVAVSGVMHWLTKDVEGMSELQRRRRAAVRGNAGSAIDRFFADDEIVRWATHWREPIDAIADAGRSLERIVIRYEAMSADLAHELRRICEFLGVSAADESLEPCLEASTFERMSGGRRRGDDAPGAHVRKGVVGDWRRYFTARDAALFDRVAGEALTDWGYEPDRTWLSEAPPTLPVGQP